jgi:hypothetical protein
MTTKIFRSNLEPIRAGLSWDETWRGSYKGLIKCWEVGRELRDKQPELAKRAENGELPVLGWKGGVAEKIQKDEKYGTFNYLAQWQGLRGEDLDIDLSEEKTLVCSRTGMRIIYTSDRVKYLSP